MIDNIPPEIGWPLAAVLWTVVIVMMVRSYKRGNKR